MSSKIKLVNRIRIWSFVICFTSGGLLILGHFGHFGFDKVLTNALWDVLESVSRISAVLGVVTTFIVLINNAGDGLNTLQRKKNAKREKKRH